MSSIKLIVGLGNPGEQYEKTRHNAGFWFVEEVARHFNVPFRLESKFFGEFCRIQSSTIDVWLLKPLVYMNRSGQAIQAVSKFYKIKAQDILIAHDELDLDPGSVRLKIGGGHGGHNGLRDTISALDSKEFYRLRLGIGHPGNKSQVVDYVLKTCSKEDKQEITDKISQVMTFFEDIVKGEFEKAMNQLHGK